MCVPHMSAAVRGVLTPVCALRAPSGVARARRGHCEERTGRRGPEGMGEEGEMRGRRGGDRGGKKRREERKEEKRGKERREESKGKKK